MKQQLVKDGHVTTANSPAEAVRLRFDGWRELPAEPAEAEATTTPEREPVAAAEKPAPKKRTARK